MTDLAALAKRFDTALLGYCAQNGFERDSDWVMLKLLEEVGELTQVWNRLTGRGRPGAADREALLHDLESEAADVLGMVLLLSHQHGMDLPAAIARKWRFDPSDGQAAAE